MYILADTPSLASQFIRELRDQTVQTDPMRFRTNLRRIGNILAFELSKTLRYKPVAIQTPLMTTSGLQLDEQVVLLAVLRAALPFHQGFLDFFDQAENGFIGASREEGGPDPEVNLSYCASPSISGKTIIFIDPMLATGNSVLKSLEALKKFGIPKFIHFASVVAAPEGIAHLEKHLDLPHQFWIGALDEKLNDKAYILPGLGDAGDLAFGSKL